MAKKLLIVFLILFSVLIGTSAFAVDTTPPVGRVEIENTKPTNFGINTIKNRNVTLSVTAIDEESGMNRVAIANEDDLSAIDWIEWDSLTATEEENTKTISWELSEGDGNKIVYAILEDKAGNTSTVYNNEIKYIVTYDANGGENAPAAQQKNVGEPLTISETIPTRDGYDFMGWSTSSTATEASYDATHPYTSNADATLYAVWGGSYSQYAEGAIFGDALRALAYRLSNITSISWQSGDFSEDDVPANAVDVSTEGMTIPIYAWFEKTNGDTGIIKLWSEANNISLNDNCKRMFKWMAITSIDVMNDLHVASTSNVTDMSEMFALCEHVESIDLSGFDTSNVTDMSQMFENNKKLTSLDISSFDTSNVTNMYYMFRGNDINPNIDVSNFNTSKVTNMEGMFRYCQGVTELDLTNFDTRQVTNMNDMFLSMINVEKIYASGDFDVSSVTSSSNMFKECNSLKGGNGTEFLSTNPKDKTYAHIDGYNDLPGYFWSHEQFTVTFNANAGGDTVTGMPQSGLRTYGDVISIDGVHRDNYLFGGFAYSPDAHVADFRAGSPIHVVKDMNLYAIWTNFAQYIDGPSFNVKIRQMTGEASSDINDVSKTNKKIKKIEWHPELDESEIPDDAELVSVDENLPIYAWYVEDTINNDGKGSIMLWSNCPYIIFNDNATNMLRNLNKLNTLDPLGDLGVTDTSNVVLMNNMFKRTMVRNLDLSGFNTSNVTSMESLFSNCTNLISLNLANWDTSKVTNMQEMFRKCNRAEFKTLDLTSFDTSSLTNAESMFRECSNLEKIYVSTGFVLGDAVTKSNYMFTDCSAITGGNGTTYDSGHVNKEYARVDGYNGLQGYFWCHDEYTVSFDANANGDTVTGMPTTKTKTYGVDLSLTETPQREGYVFKGWSTSASATDPTYNSTNPYTTNAAALLYAVWGPGERTVSFNFRGVNYDIWDIESDPEGSEITVDPYVTLNIYDDSECTNLIKTLTDDEVYSTTLPIGTYYLQVSGTPIGYNVNNDTITIEVDDSENIECIVPFNMGTQLPSSGGYFSSNTTGNTVRFLLSQGISDYYSDGVLKIYQIGIADPNSATGYSCPSYLQGTDIQDYYLVAGQHVTECAEARRALYQRILENEITPVTTLTFDNNGSAQTTLDYGIYAVYSDFVENYSQEHKREIGEIFVP